jgi:hypothetical protein
MKYQIQEVNTKKREKQFINLPVSLYKNEKNWIRPLDKDIQKTFDPKRNKYFRHGKAIRWILTETSTGKVIGRVAAFVDEKTANKKNEQPTGGMGFFECVDNQEAANILFDTAKNWLQENGMEAMDGPINFGDRNENWGLLVKGDFPPNYGMPYQFPYYQKLFENYGFKVFFRQLTYHRKIIPGQIDLTPKVIEKAEAVIADPNYSFQHVNMSHFHRYAEELRKIYNKAWAKFVGLGDMSKPQASTLIKKLKPLIDPRLFWIGYYKKEPVAMFLSLPDLNQVFKHVNGKLNWLGKLKLLYILRTGKIHKAIGTLFGVVPDHQGKGVEAAIVMAFAKYISRYKKFQYTDLEMNWIGDFNPKMMRVAEQVGGKILKVHHTYRYLFDQTKPFTRMPVH